MIQCRRCEWNKLIRGRSARNHPLKRVFPRFTGCWELQIQPYEGDGLSFSSPAAQVTKNIKFDGNDYPDLGPNVAPGSASSGRRVNGRSLEITDKFQGKITDTRQIELSTDLKTLTITVRMVGQSKPSDVLVFDRE